MIVVSVGCLLGRVITLSVDQFVSLFVCLFVCLIDDTKMSTLSEVWYSI